MSIKKYLLFIVLCAPFSFIALAQVGVNTTEPTATLDVNGTLRVRELTDDTIVATKIIGLDDEGHFVEIEVDENLRLVDNKLIAVNRTLRFANIPAFTQEENHNVSLAVWPGESNEGKSIVRIKNLSNIKTIITGIEAGSDGMHIYLFAATGEIELVPNSTDSDAGNRIEQNDKMGAKQYEMIELVYDVESAKWIVMQNHK